LRCSMAASICSMRCSSTNSATNLKNSAPTHCPLDKYNCQRGYGWRFTNQSECDTSHQSSPTQCFLVTCALGPRALRINHDRWWQHHDCSGKPAAPDILRYSGEYIQRKSKLSAVIMICIIILLKRRRTSRLFCSSLIANHCTTVLSRFVVDYRALLFLLSRTVPGTSSIGSSVQIVKCTYTYWPVEMYFKRWLCT
jgi:hypothetical protein